MAKAKTERRLKDNEAQAIARTLRVSPQKLNLVAALIRGKKVDRALAGSNSPASASQGPSRRRSNLRLPMRKTTMTSTSTLSSSPRPMLASPSP